MQSPSYQTWRANSALVIARAVIGSSLAIMLVLSSPALGTDQPTPIGPQLTTVLQNLTDQLNRANAVVELLRQTAKEGPEQAQRQVESTSKALGDLADRLRDDGEILAQLRALRSAAEAHRARVERMQGISEQARSEVLSRWTSLLQQIDTTQSAVDAMRDKILSLLGELRRVQVDVAEFVLVGSYEDALKAVNDWLKDLGQSVDQMRATIKAIVPGPGV
jgi:chromosome segregation ATPase